MAKTLQKVPQPCDLLPAHWEDLGLPEKPDSVEKASGGLFNRVYRIASKDKVRYLKQLTETAESGTFPPLPTSAISRWRVASECHARAERAAIQNPCVRIPHLVKATQETQSIVMESVDGHPLYETLTREGMTPDVNKAMLSIMAWLRALHSQPVFSDNTLIADSEPFRHFKIDLQYFKILKELPPSLETKAKNFAENYLQSHSAVLHGDLNSRNILMQDPARPAIIDFEQGQLGDGVYDVAYLISEAVIADIWQARNPEESIKSLWKAYGAPQAEQAFLAHLGFQVIYRLIGPSRHVWSAHLPEDKKQHARAWAANALEMALSARA